MMQICNILRERKKAHLETLEREIFSSRMQIKAERLYSYALLSGALSGIATFLLLIYLSRLIIPQSYYLTIPLLGVVLILVWIAIALVSLYGAFAAALYLPKAELASRRMRIDVSLFNVTTYLYALHKSEPNLYALIESLAQYADYYGEAAREFRQVVFDCQICSMDFYSALSRLAETTPSDKFRFFLTGLASSYKTLGSANDYLRMKVEELREEQRISQKVYLNTLGIIAEMYITIFVAGPLFIIIVVMVMGMITSANPAVLALIIYVMLPVGTAIFLLMMDLISEVHEDKSAETHDTKRAIWEKKPEFPSIPVVMPRESETPAFERLARRDTKEKLLQFLRSPIAYMKMHPATVFIFSIPCALLATGFLYFFFVPVPLTAETFLPWVTAAEDIILSGVLILLIPFAVMYTIYSRQNRRIEESIPDFADQMASAVRHNMTLARAIDLIAMEGKSNMLDEIRMIHRDIFWGSLTSDAMKRFSEHVRIGAIDRMSILVSQAEHFTNNLSQVLQIIADDAKNMVSLKSERRGDMLLYVIVVYLAFFVFVFVQAILVVMFLPMMIQDGGGMSMIGSGVSIPGAGNGLSLELYDQLMYHSVVIHGFCSGLVAGMMGEGSALAGVKHSCVMMSIAMIVFVILKMFFLS